MMTTKKRSSKVFKPFSKTILPPNQIYSSKVYTDARKGQHIAGLQEKSQRFITMPSPRDSIEYISD